MFTIIRVVTKSGNSAKIREFYFQSRKIRGNFWNIRENQGNLRFLIVSFRSCNVLHTQPYIQLSMIAAKFYPFVYLSVLYSHFEMQFRFCYEAKN